LCLQISSCFAYLAKRKPRFYADVDPALCPKRASNCRTPGYQFEHFLALILGALGLEDVRVTRPSRDGGIDLTATRAGITELKYAVHTNYRVQAKRLNPSTAVSMTDVRALRGVLKSGEVGLFISTGRFTPTAMAFLDQDDSRPLILIDGPEIVKLCKAHQIGIRHYPYFDASSLSAQMNSPTANTITELTNAKRVVVSTSKHKKNEGSWTTTVSVNDVRARILPIPKDILAQVDLSAQTIEVVINGIPSALRFNRGRRYVAGVADVFRSAGLLLSDNSRRSGICHWKFDPASKQAEAHLVASVELPTP
jgi:restriction system protein